uniref:Phosphatidylinositol 3-kinase root isoform isoform X1 n=1 Tax=Rhizophora mucronata TaxID=61149 RepID=A0A2P2KKP9_RHIMU
MYNAHSTNSSALPSSATTVESTPELGHLEEGRQPSSLSTQNVTGRLMSHDKKKRNSFPLMLFCL